MIEDIVDELIASRPVYGIVYLAVNNINRKKYIGITKYSVKVRFQSHLAHGKTLFDRALRQYGMESFTVSIIDSAFDLETLCEKEQYWIQQCGSLCPIGYNQTTGGIQPEMSAATRAKMSASHKGKKRPETSIRLKGKKRPDISARMRGRKLSKAWCEAISRSKIGKPRSELARIATKLGKIGKSPSLETRQKLRESQLGHKHTFERKRNIRLGNVLGAGWQSGLPNQYVN